MKHTKAMVIRPFATACRNTYKGSDAASTGSGLEVTLQLLLDSAGGVESLSQQDDGVDEKEGGNAIDDVLKDLDAKHRTQSCQLRCLFKNSHNP